MNEFWQGLEIEKNIPIPESRSGKNIRLLEKLGVGDSVYFNQDSTSVFRKYYNPAKRMGIKIVIRKQPDGGCRLWRFE